MAGIGLTLIGVKELVKKLDKGYQNLLREREKTMKKAVLMIERDAKKNVAVDTGRLRASITHEIAKKGDIITGETGAMNIDNVSATTTVHRARGDKRGKPIAFAGPMKVKYARYQEFGKSGKYKFKPFLRPAIRKNKAKIDGMFTELMVKIKWE